MTRASHHLYSIGRLAVLAAGAAAWPQAAQACELKLLGEIPIAMEDGRPMIAGKINGHDVTMLADTGASSSTIAGPTVAAMGLRTTQVDGVRFVGVGGSIKANKANIDTIKLGTLSFGPLSMFVAGNDGPDALIGTDVLGLSPDLEVDLAHNAIRLLKSKDCAEGEVIYWKTPFAMEKLEPFTSKVTKEYRVKVTVNGRRLEALLDTGAQMSVLTLDGARKSGILLSDEAVRNAGLLSGVGEKTVSTVSVKLDLFEFDQEKIMNTRIHVADLFRATKEAPLGTRLKRAVMDEPSMILGADFFLAHRVFIATEEKKVYITYSGGPIFRTEPEPAAAPAAPPPEASPAN